MVTTTELRVVVCCALLWSLVHTGSPLQKMNPRMVSWNLPSGFVLSTTYEERGLLSYLDKTYRLFNKNSNDVYELKSNAASVYVEYIFPRRTKVNKYRIVFRPSIRPSHYPRSWKVYGSDLQGSEPASASDLSSYVLLHEEEDATFVGGRYLTTRLDVRRKFRRYRFVFSEDNTPGDGSFDIAMSELNLFGYLGQLDGPFPGGYPCSKVLELVTPFGGPPASVFSTDDPHTSNAPSWAFDYRLAPWVSFPVPAANPANIGVKLAERVTVYQYRVVDSNSFLSRSNAPRDWEFQGRNCIGECFDLVDAGWVTLHTVTGHTYDSPDTFDVSTPGSYSAYRLRITKDNNTNPSHPVYRTQVAEFVLFGCRT